MSFWWATLHSNVYPCIFILLECYNSSNTFYNRDGTGNLYCAYSVALSAVCSLLYLLLLHSDEAWQGREWEGRVESTCCQYMCMWACMHASSLCFLLCLAEIGFKRGNKTSCGLLKKNLLSVNNSIVHTSTVWNGCLQDHLNKNRRNLQLLMIEKKIDDILQHWRSRIGLEKKQVVSSTCFPSLRETSVLFACTLSA